MPASLDLMLDVARASLATRTAFSNSLRYWQSPTQSPAHSGMRWKEISSPQSDVLIGERDGIVIEGDCRHRISAPEGGAVHIIGDFHSTCDLGRHTEVVIAGDVMPDASFSISGISRVFISGNVRGLISSEGSLALWVSGNFSGQLETGHPSTDLWIGGDYSGNLRPREMASLLSLSVAGYAHADACKSIIDHGYTIFEAIIGTSSVPKGIYPVPDEYEALAKNRSFNRWCVLSDE